MKRLLASSFAALLLCLPVTLVAELVSDLHAARVPVADRGAKALSVAARDAMSEVLVKVSGSQAVLQNPTIAEALRGARGQVQQYVYDTDAVLGESTSLWVRVEFDSGHINQLIADAGAPLWTANRPPALAWLVVEDDSGRQFVNAESAPDLTMLLQQEFARRGVPVKLPLFDLADTAALGVDSAWRLDGSALRGASARYGVQDVIAGRVTRLSTGQLLGDWAYFHGEQRTDRTVTAGDPRSYLREGVAMVASDMASRYAIAPVAGAGDALTMVVSGVRDYSDYAALLAWLRGIELVEQANVANVNGDVLRLRIEAQAEPAQLATLIELNERLVPAMQPVADAALAYEWRR